ILPSGVQIPPSSNPVAPNVLRTPPKAASLLFGEALNIIPSAPRCQWPLRNAVMAHAAFDAAK
ncbi:MAG TPA: hypothetical protein VK747_18835, partial [Blastocatellia bacterium]|nr:hypothetical protein [Blastocatellia bacterium]